MWKLEVIIQNNNNIMSWGHVWKQNHIGAMEMSWNAMWKLEVVNISWSHVWKQYQMIQWNLIITVTYRSVFSGYFTEMYYVTYDLNCNYGVATLQSDYSSEVLLY